MITRIRPVEDTAQWVAGDTGQIVEAVKLSDLESVHIDDLADCAHQLNGALEARDAAERRAAALEARLATPTDSAESLRRDRNKMADALEKTRAELTSATARALATAAEESARMYAERSQRWERDAEQARTALGRCREVLQDVEWSGYESFEQAGKRLCPYCEMNSIHGHTKDCALSAALKEDDNV